MKKNVITIVLCVVIAAIILSLAIAVSYSVQSLTALPFSIYSWQSWLLTIVVYALMCGTIRGVYEMVDYVRYSIDN